MSKNEDILSLAVERFAAAMDSDKDERKQAEDDLKFAIDDEGCQWPNNIRERRQNDKPERPCLVLNKIPEKIDQVEGEFRQALPTVYVMSVDCHSDPQIAEILGGIIRHIEYNSTARSAYNMAHSSVLYCGRGAWRINIEDAEHDPFVRDIVIDRIPNIFTVYWDPGAKKADKSDAEYVFVTENITEKAFKRKYPKIPIVEWDGSNEEMEHWRTDKTVRIAEYWWKEKVDKTFYQVERNIAGRATSLAVTDKQRQPTDRVTQEKTVKVPQVKWAKLVFGHIIKGPEDWAGRNIPIVIETGKEVNIAGQAKNRGMVRFGKEPQRVYNYSVTAEVERYALASKAPSKLTPAQIAGHEEQWNNSHIRNYPYLLYNIDPKNPNVLPFRDVPTQPSGLIHERQAMEHDIMSAMGVHEASLGEPSKEKSGLAIRERKQQTSIGSYTYTDNFETAYIYSTKILIDLIPYVYDTERIIRIRGEDDTEKMVPINARPDPITKQPLLPEMQQVPENMIVGPKQGVTEYINDLGIGKYDVVCTIGPSFVTQRQEALQNLLELADKVPPFAMATVDLIVKNLDVPGSDELMKRAKRLVPPGIRDLEPGEEPPPEQPPDPKVMIEMAKLELQQIKQELDGAREDFKAEVDAISKLAAAEAQERGQQLDELIAIVGELRANSEQQQGPQPQGQV